MTSADRFLGGRLIVRQPLSGFRAGLDAVMLAAAVPACEGEQALELGGGVGTASLCLATRVCGCQVTGVEIDPDLAALANDNAGANGLRDRVRFEEGDVLDLSVALKRDFDHVFCNPPFHFEAGAASPDAARDRALRDQGRLMVWIETGFRRTISGGSFTAIIRADRVRDVLSALPERGVSIFPLWPRREVEAKRVIVQAIKGAGYPARMLPGLVLHDANGQYMEAADAILRGIRPDGLIAGA